MSTNKKTPTFYDILGIDSSASSDEVRKAYRKRALETHPDKLDPSATDQEKQATQHEFHKVQEAFETLNDAQKKRRYDAILALRLDPKFVSKDSAKRMADRREWAREQAELAKRRLDALRANRFSPAATPAPPPPRPPPPTAPKTAPATFAPASTQPSASTAPSPTPRASAAASPTAKATPAPARAATVPRATPTPARTSTAAPTTTTTPQNPAPTEAPKPPKSAAQHERNVRKVKDILDELLNAHPEFAARKRVVLQRKAEREERERELNRQKEQAKRQLKHQAQEPPLTA